MKQIVLKIGFMLVVFCLLIGTSNAVTTSMTLHQLPMMTYGTTFYVGGSGPGNYTKIQDAIDNASDGDTVFVYDDSSPYYENLRIEKAVSLIGENKDTTVIDGDGQLSVILIINADGVTIRGFTIQNSGVLWINHGVDIHSSYNTITDNIIKENTIGIGLYTTDEHSANHNTLSNNIIEKNEDKGILLSQSHYTNITSNTISDNFGGLVLATSYHNTISENVFVNDGLVLYSSSYPNTLLNNTVNGKPLICWSGLSDKILLEDAGQVILINCNRITVQNQDLSHGSVGLMLLNTHNSFLSNNTLNSNDWYGILLRYSNGNNLSKNKVSDCSDGIALDVSDENRIIWNQISLNTNSGIYLFYSDNNTIVSNSIQKNGGRKWVESREGLRLRNSSDTSIRNNNFIRNAFDAYMSGTCLRNQWDGNYWSRPRLLPKMILDRSIRPIFSSLRLNIDWHPAQEPYNIPGMS